MSLGRRPSSTTSFRPRRRRVLEQHAKRDQRELNGMQAQIAVVQAGPGLLGRRACVGQGAKPALTRPTRASFGRRRIASEGHRPTSNP